MPEVTIACVLYQGEDVPAHSLGIFTPEWVDRLYRGIKRNTTREFRFVCFVDRDDYEFHEPIETKKLVMPYRNMFSLLEPFREDMGRVVFMGLDTIIVGNIDWLLDYRGPFAMLQDPYFDRPCSGVMAFPYTPQVWEAFVAEHDKHARKHTMFGFPSDMIFLATVPHVRLQATDTGFGMQDAADLSIDTGMDMQPYVRRRRGGIYSYKAHCRKGLPPDACIIYFHGKEKPHELKADWIERHWGPPLLQFVTGLNTPMETMIRQAEENLSRDLPMFMECPANLNEALIVGGGPSLQHNLPNLRMRRDRGGIIFALNGTHDWLIDRGIVPDFHVMLDARQENVQFVRRPHKDVTYLIAAQCHPDVFNALKGYKVIVWLGCFDTREQENDLAKKFPNKPIMLVGGGATVGLKTMNLAYLAGFRKLHFYGFDSCYSGESNHAYPQPLNDKESRIEVIAAGKKFTCAPWMAKQAMEFQSQMRQLLDAGCQIYVHGNGLIPWIVQQHQGGDR